MKKNYYLEKLYSSDKPFIVYKVQGGYDLFTDFSEKIYIKCRKTGETAVRGELSKTYYDAQ